MVSLRRSHCHSASETFIGRLCDRTRCRAVRRASSSSSRSRSDTSTSARVARRTTWRSTVFTASATAQPPQPRAHFLSAVSPIAETRPRSWPRSTSTMTASCGASVSSADQLKYSSRLPLNRTSTTAVTSLLGERAHGEILLLAPLQQFVDLDAPQLAQMAAQRFTQGLGGDVRVGVRPARRLGDDFVDQLQAQQVLRRELE